MSRMFDAPLVRSMVTVRLLVAALVALAFPAALTGCGNRDAEKPAASESESELQTAADEANDENGEQNAEAPAEPEADKPTADELPLPEDFEAEAAAAITPENLESELQALEREVNSDPVPKTPAQNPKAKPNPKAAKAPAP
ncbi:MAG: hypothetical protein R3A78_15490 [Polyangiales bacterium]